VAITTPVRSLYSRQQTYILQLDLGLDQSVTDTSESQVEGAPSLEIAQTAQNYRNCSCEGALGDGRTDGTSILFSPVVQISSRCSRIHSATTNIVTVRTSVDKGDYTTEGDARKWQRTWKEGIWTLQVNDYMKKFPRIWGNSSSYTPLPPLDGEHPGDLRLLVHRQQDDDAATDAVHEKISGKGTLIRMAQPKWTGFVAPISKDSRQVVILASGVKGIAPMLQTIHTLLEARRGDGVLGRRPEVHVVWFNQNLERVDENEMAPSNIASFEASIANKIATAELERLRLAYPDKLVIETIDVGNTFAQVTMMIKSASKHCHKPPLLERWSMWASWGSLKNTDSDNLLFISGSRDFADSLSGYNEGQSGAKNGSSIITTAEQAGWRILNFSKMEVCT
jgi:hypothetical protein